MCFNTAYTVPRTIRFPHGLQIPAENQSCWLSNCATMGVPRGKAFLLGHPAFAVGA